MTGKTGLVPYVLEEPFLLYTWFVSSCLYSVSSLFPGSLRYIVQQHLDLLHALQERVLKWPRQGVLGDLFLKLTNDEVSFFFLILYKLELHASVSSMSISLNGESRISGFQSPRRSSLTSLFYR